jgi:hypothetical protein
MIVFKNCLIASTEERIIGISLKKRKRTQENKEEAKKKARIFPRGHIQFIFPNVVNAMGMFMMVLTFAVAYNGKLDIVAFTSIPNPHSILTRYHYTFSGAIDPNDIKQAYAMAISLLKQQQYRLLGSQFSNMPRHFGESTEQKLLAFQELISALYSYCNGYACSTYYPGTGLESCTIVQYFFIVKDFNGKNLDMEKDDIVLKQVRRLTGKSEYERLLITEYFYRECLYSLDNVPLQAMELMVSKIHELSHRDKQSQLFKQHIPDIFALLDHDLFPTSHSDLEKALQALLHIVEVDNAVVMQVGVNSTMFEVLYIYWGFFGMYR